MGSEFVWDMAPVRSGEGKGAGLGGRGVRPAGGVLRFWGILMTTIVSLVKDRAGASSTRLALMIGLSSSALLVLVRIGVAAAGQ